MARAGVVQQANGSPAKDFWAYAVERLKRCRALMGTAAYANAVANVERGP